MHKSKYTVTHTHARYVSVYVRISSYEKSPFRPPALISQNVAADPFFMCCAHFRYCFFSLRWAALFLCQIIAIITWNMETLRFAYKFISAGLPAWWLQRTEQQQKQQERQRRDDGWGTEWLTHWPQCHLLATPQLLQHLPHTQQQHWDPAYFCWRFGIAFLRILQRTFSYGRVLRGEEELTRR